MKFYSDVSGFITAIRFYKGPGNNGTHVAHLWDNQGNLLSTATFTNETASGWQQVALPAPVPINANQIYIASYWDPDGYYALDRPYFTSQYDNPPLHAPADGAYGPNAVFYPGSSGFPTETFQSSNYWVDVVFESSSTSPAPASGSTLWSESTVPAVPSFPDNASYEIGVKFYSDVSGFITAIRFYKGPGNNDTHVAHLWDDQGNLLSTATFTNETASGWQQVALPAPVPINANQVYIASYWDPDGYYALDRPYFTSQYDNPPLHTPADGAYGPNAVFRTGSSGFPTETFQSSNYWVDVVFESSNSAPPPVGTSLLILSPATLSFGNIAVGSSSILPVVAVNSGTSDVTISQAAISGAGFFVSGPALPLTLAAGQNASFSVTFDPSVSGSATGSLSVISDAADSPNVVSLSATGDSQHSVTLTWVASTSPNITGYNVYRSTVSGGPYTQLNTSLVADTSYTDSTVQGGETYYYATTAVNSQGVESANSNEAIAITPFP